MYVFFPNFRFLAFFENFGPEMGSRGAGRGLKRFLEAVGFILAKQPKPSHGDPIRDQNYGLGTYDMCQNIYIYCKYIYIYTWIIYIWIIYMEYIYIYIHIYIQREREIIYSLLFLSIWLHRQATSGLNVRTPKKMQNSPKHISLKSY